MAKSMDKVMGKKNNASTHKKRTFWQILRRIRPGKLRILVCNLLMPMILSWKKP